MKSLSDYFSETEKLVSLKTYISEALISNKVKLGNLFKLDNGTYFLCNGVDIKYIVLKDEQSTYIIINPKNALKQSEVEAIYDKLFSTEDNVNMYDIFEIYKDLLNTTHGKHLDKTIQATIGTAHGGNSCLSRMTEKLTILCGELNFLKDDKDLKKLKGIVFEDEENLEQYDSIYLIKGNTLYTH